MVACMFSLRLEGLIAAWLIDYIIICKLQLQWYRLFIWRLQLFD